ncbi:hypothetical protein SARC_11069, partial [Sphaeroforma arctica JP610]
MRLVVVSPTLYGMLINPTFTMSHLVSVKPSSTSTNAANNCLLLLLRSAFGSRSHKTTSLSLLRMAMIMNSHWTRALKDICVGLIVCVRVSRHIRRLSGQFIGQRSILFNFHKAMILRVCTRAISAFSLLYSFCTYLHHMNIHDGGFF